MPSMAVLGQPASPSTRHCGERQLLDPDDSPWPPMPPPKPPTPRLDLVLVVEALRSGPEHSVDVIDPELAPAAADPTTCDLMPSATELNWAVVHGEPGPTILETSGLQSLPFVIVSVESCHSWSPHSSKAPRTCDNSHIVVYKHPNEVCSAQM